MSVTVQTVAPEDTLEIQRQKINNNDGGLKDASNALESQQAAHLGTGHPSLYYTKTEIGSQQDAQDNNLATHKTSGDHDGRYDALGAAAAVTSALNTHKTSGDHDGRYDALGAAAAVTSALNTHKASGDHDGRYDALGAAAAVTSALNTHKASGDHDTRYLQIANLLSQLNTVLAANAIEFPRGATKGGKSFATEDYVQQRVKNGSYYIGGFTLRRSDNTFGDFYFGSEANPQILVPSIGSKISGISVIVKDYLGGTNVMRTEFPGFGSTFLNQTDMPFVIYPKITVGAEGVEDLTVRLKMIGENLDTGSGGSIGAPITLFNEVIYGAQGPNIGFLVGLTFNLTI